jgi:hypothetical protein
MEQKMVRISVEVRSDATCFRVGVRARSIREALALVGGRYPRREVGVVFAIEPEGFFVREISAPAEIAGPERAHTAAA